MNQNKPILFVDFDGTICYDRYWRSLPVDQYESVQKFLFQENIRIVMDWMRGNYTAEDINKIVSDHLNGDYETIWNLFVNDCKTMQISAGVLETISELRKKYVVILITGNMDSFNRFTVTELELEKYFDEISSSYDEKLLKSDNEGELFLKYLGKYSADIKKSVLIDDSKSTCKTFDKLGGKSFLIENEKGIERYLEILA